MTARDKGNGAEREVAALLADWWSLHEPGARFVRTPGSGGWQEPQVRAEFRACGDITTTSRTFPWCVEVKRREAWAWAPLLAGRASPVWKWWAQAREDAARAGLAPMLWFRHNREPWAVMLRVEPPGVPMRFITELREAPERAALVNPAEALLAVPPMYLIRFGA